LPAPRITRAMPSRGRIYRPAMIKNEDRSAARSGSDRAKPVQAAGPWKPGSVQRPVELPTFGVVGESLKKMGCPIVDAIRAKSRHHGVPAVLALIEFGEVEAIMTNRPKRPVGEAVIILFDIAARKVAYRIGERSNSPALGGGAALLAGFARPAEPEAATRLERRLQRDRKPTGRGRYRGGRQGHTIRDDDQSTFRLAAADSGRFVEKFQVNHGHDHICLSNPKY
jgi:hypothetical protein